MIGICGVVGSARPSGNGTRNPHFSQAECHSLRVTSVTPDEETWLAADSSSGATCSSAELAVAICGRPRFDKSTVAATAEAAGPAAAVIALYGEYGQQFLDHIHGSFALALVERRSGVTTLAIDRAGIETLSYACTNGAVGFASQLDALLSTRVVDAVLDPQAVFDYFFFHVIPAPGSIYRGIRKLLPGERVIVKRGAVQASFYWRLAYHDAASLAEAEMAETFRNLVRESVRRAADADTATFLSGGTDSSTVTGYLASVRQGPVEAYSIGFDATGFDESEYARIAAKRFGVNHHEYYLTPDDVVHAVPLLALQFDEPFGNASVVPAYRCASLARDGGAASMLAGDGGDEIFGGNARYAKQMVFEMYGKLPRALRVGLVEPLVAGLPGRDRIKLLRKAASYVEQARIPLPDRLESYNFLRRSPLGDVFDEEFLSAVSPQHPEELLREPYERALANHPLDRMMHLDLKLTLADNDLRKVVGACRCAGVEARFPLLADEVVEFSGTLPPSWKVHGQSLRYFFKRALRDFLPQEIITKTKHGFGLPFGVWMREHAGLRDLAGDSLQSFRARGYLRRSYIDNLLAQHHSEHASYYGVMIWVILMMEQWLSSKRH